MEGRPEVGQEVTSRRFGAGVVLQVVSEAAVVSFKRLGGLKCQVPLSDLGYDAGATAEVDEGAAGTPTRQTSPRASMRASSQRQGFSPRRTIDALRFGVVPSSGLADLTVGYAELATKIQQGLPHSRGGVPTFMEIAGAFGSGKSHAMAVVRQVANEHGYVTASVEIDGVSVSFARPADLLHHLLRSVRTPGETSTTPLFDMHVAAYRRAPAAAMRVLPSYPNLWANYRAVSVFASAGESDSVGELLEIVLGSSDEMTPPQVALALMESEVFGRTLARPTRLVGTRLVNQPSDFADALLGYAALAKLAGFSGLVVTIDEFEVEQAFLTGAGRARMLATLDVLGQRVLASKEGVPLGLFVATVEDTSAWADHTLSNLRSAIGGELYRLLEPGDSGTVELGARVAKLYGRGYGIDVDTAMASTADLEKRLNREVVRLGGRVRAFVRAYVDRLDGLHGPSAS